MDKAALDKTANALLTAQDTLIKFLLEYGFKLLGAAVIVTAGVILSRYLAKFLQERLEKVDIEPPVRLLVVRALRVVVVGFTLLIAVQKLGVDIMPLVAGVGVLGVGVGLATQGVLSNAAAGLIIIFTKPYRVGEYIEIVAVEGLVTSIELFSTTLEHADKSRIVIPNRKIVGEILHNYGTIRQLALTVGVAYNTDLNVAISIIREVLAQSPRVKKDLPPVVGVSMLADSSINIAVKPWTAVKDFGPAHAEICQGIVDQFRARGIEIPFPQREVRVLSGGMERAA